MTFLYFHRGVDDNHGKAITPTVGDEIAGTTGGDGAGVSVAGWEGGDGVGAGNEIGVGGGHVEVIAGSVRGGNGDGDRRGAKNGSVVDIGRDGCIDSARIGGDGGVATAKSDLEDGSFGDGDGKINGSGMGTSNSQRGGYS